MLTPTALLSHLADPYRALHTLSILTEGVDSALRGMPVGIVRAEVGSGAGAVVALAGRKPPW